MLRSAIGGKVSSWKSCVRPRRMSTFTGPVTVPGTGTGTGTGTGNVDIRLGTDTEIKKGAVFSAFFQFNLARKFLEGCGNREIESRLLKLVDARLVPCRLGHRDVAGFESDRGRQLRAESRLVTEPGLDVFASFAGEEARHVTAGFQVEILIHRESEVGVQTSDRRAHFVALFIKVRHFHQRG